MSVMSSGAEECIGSEHVFIERVYVYYRINEKVG